VVEIGNTLAEDRIPGIISSPLDPVAEGERRSRRRIWSFA
jgi:hypothetical protein